MTNLTENRYKAKLSEMKSKIEANKEEMERLWSAQHTLENGKRWECLDDENWKIKEEIKQLNISWVRRNWTAVDYSYHEMVSNNVD